MPPRGNSAKGRLIKRDPLGIVEGGEDLTSFFTPEAVAAGFRSTRWSISEMVGILAEMARDSEVSPRERMAAMRLLDDKAKEALTIGGYLQKISQSVERSLPEGGVSRLSVESVEVISQETDRTLRTLALLEKGSQTEEIIDVEVLEESNDGPEDSRTDETGRHGGSPGGGRGVARSGDSPTVHGRQRTGKAGKSSRPKPRGHQPRAKEPHPGPPEPTGGTQESDGHPNDSSDEHGSEPPTIAEIGLPTDPASAQGRRPPRLHPGRVL